MKNLVGIYLPVYVTPRRDYNWTICEELLLSCLSEIVLKQYESF